MGKKEGWDPQVPGPLARWPAVRWPEWHVVVQSPCDGHMTLEGIHIPEAMGVLSNHGSGCDFRGNWERPMGPGQV